MNPIASPVALSPLHHQHVELGAEMELIDGWLLPSRYTSADKELVGLRSDVGICDVSPMGKLSLQGDNVDALLGGLFPKAAKLEIGQAVQANDEAAVARLTQDETWLTTAASHPRSMSERLATDAEGCWHVVDITSALAAVRIVGPKTRHVLSAVTELDVSPESFGNGRCAQSQFAEIHGALIRLDASDLPAYTLFFGREYGDYVWESLMEAGHRYDLVTFGVEALEALR